MRSLIPPPQRSVRRVQPPPAEMAPDQTAVQSVEKAGQALLDHPLVAANNVLPLLAKLRNSAAHDEVGCRPNLIQFWFRYL